VVDEKVVGPEVLLHLLHLHQVRKKEKKKKRKQSQSPSTAALRMVAEPREGKQVLTAAGFQVSSKICKQPLLSLSLSLFHFYSFNAACPGHLPSLHPFQWCAGRQRGVVHREEPHGGAILRGHVGHSGTVRKGQAAHALACKRASREEGAGSLCSRKKDGQVFPSSAHATEEQLLCDSLRLFNSLQRSGSSGLISRVHS